ncbi:MAG: hypothetical protein ACKOTZ_05060 [Chloroflexota bacterium]
MTRPRRIRALVLTAGIALGLLAGSAATHAGIPIGERPAGDVIWVDADGRAGPLRCNGGASALTTIQGGVDVARPGRTVRVCPGTYREQVVIRTDAITLEADRPWTATIRPEAPPAGARIRPARMGAMVIVDAAAGVTVQGLRLSVGSGVLPGFCRYIVSGIVALEAPRVRILSNRLIGGATVDSTRCGLLNGIEVIGSDGATVAWNLVRNFRLLGIGVDNGPLPVGAMDVRIFRNELYWQHTGVECQEVGSDCFDPVDVPPTFLFSEGISLGWVTAEVRRNTIVSDAPRSSLDGGIGAHSSAVTAVANIVRGADHGIFVDGSGGLVLRNRLMDGDTTGILVEGDGCASGLRPGGCAASDAAAPAGCVAGAAGCPLATLVVRGNDVTGYADYGIRTTRGGGTYIDNDARGNPGVDCADDSGRPVLNTWTGNLGYGARPRAICGPRRG